MSMECIAENEFADYENILENTVTLVKKIKNNLLHSCVLEDNC